MPQFLSTADPDFDASFAALLTMKREDAVDVDEAVAAIIADVRDRGDKAVIGLTEKYDRLLLTPQTLAFSASEIDAEIGKVLGERRACGGAIDGTCRRQSGRINPGGCVADIGGHQCRLRMGRARVIGAIQQL